MKQILVLGAGFAGLWAAIGAKRKLKEIGRDREASVAVVNPTSYHNIRVRNYEADLADVCVPLDEVLSPIGVETVLGEVRALDVGSKTVRVEMREGARTLAYDGPGSCPRQSARQPRRAGFRRVCLQRGYVCGSGSPARPPRLAAFSPKSRRSNGRRHWRRPHRPREILAAAAPVVQRPPATLRAAKG